MSEKELRKFTLNKEDILNYLSLLKEELKKDGITKLGLFGSYAKNKADLASDIDIVICTSEKFLSRFRAFEAVIYLDELRKKIMKKFKIQVDICDEAGLTKEKKEELLKGVIYV